MDAGFFESIGTTLMVLVGAGAPIVALALVAYWVIRMAVRDGMLDARRRVGELPVVEDPAEVASPTRRVLYAVGAAALLIGVCLVAWQMAVGAWISAAGLALLVVYTDLLLEVRIVSHLKAKSSWPT